MATTATDGIVRASSATVPLQFTLAMFVYTYLRYAINTYVLMTITVPRFDDYYSISSRWESAEGAESLLECCRRPPKQTNSVANWHNERAVSQFSSSSSGPRMSAIIALAYLRWMYSVVVPRCVEYYQASYQSNRRCIYLKTKNTSTTRAIVVYILQPTSPTSAVCKSSEYSEQWEAS